MTYQLGEHPEFTATIRSSKTGALADPLTVTISIKKPDGTMAITDQAMTKESEGVYYYVYAIPAETAGIEGTYKLKVEATGSASRVTIEPDSFKAEASI